MQESCSGGTGLFPAPVCSSPTFPRDQWACSLPPCVCHAQGVSLHGAPWDGTQYSGPGPPPLLQPPGGQIQPPSRNCMAQPASFRPPHPRKAFCTGTTTSLNQCTTTGCPKCHPDLREVGHSGTSHTRSSSSVAKPCHRPGRCHCVPGCHPCQAHPRSTHRQLSSLQGCRDDGVSCRSRGSQVNLSIHQGPHFLPSTLGDN